MKEVHLKKKERRRFIYLFAQLSKTQLQEVKSLVERELKIKMFNNQGKEIKKSEKKSTISKFLSLFKRERK